MLPDWLIAQGSGLWLDGTIDNKEIRLMMCEPDTTPFSHHRLSFPPLEKEGLSQRRVPGQMGTICSLNHQLEKKRAGSVPMTWPLQLITALTVSVHTANQMKLPLHLLFKKCFHVSTVTGTAHFKWKLSIKFKIWNQHVILNTCYAFVNLNVSALWFLSRRTKLWLKLVSWVNSK